MVSSVVTATHQLVEEERLGAVARVVAGPGLGMSTVIDADKGFVAGEIPQELRDDVLADAAQLMEHEQNRTLSYGDSEVYIETVRGCVNIRVGRGFESPNNS